MKRENIGKAGELHMRLDKIEMRIKTGPVTPAGADIENILYYLVTNKANIKDFSSSLKELVDKMLLAEKAQISDELRKLGVDV